MPHIANVAANRPVVQNAQDLNTTSSLTDRKVNDIRLLSNITNRDLSNYKLDAQGGLYKLGTLSQIFRNIGDVFTSNNSLKNRNMEVASKILEMRYNAADYNSIDTYGDALRTYGEALQLKIHNMDLDEAEKTIFSAHVSVLNEQLSHIRLNEQNDNYLVTINGLEHSANELRTVSNTLNTKDSMIRLANLMHWNADVQARSNIDVGIILDLTQHRASELSNKITEITQKTPVANQKLAVLCNDKFRHDIISKGFHSENLSHDLNHVTDSFRNFAIELSVDENNSVTNTTYFKNLVTNECDKLIQMYYKETSMDERTELKKAAMEAFSNDDRIIKLSNEIRFKNHDRFAIEELVSIVTSDAVAKESMRQELDKDFW